MIPRNIMKNTAIASFTSIIALAVAVIGLFQAYGNFSSAKLGGINMKFDNFVRFSCLAFVIGFILLTICLCTSYKFSKFLALFISLCFIGTDIYIISASFTEKEALVKGYKYVFDYEEEGDKSYELKSIEIENQIECCGWNSIFEPSHTCNFTETCYSKIMKLTDRTSIEISIFFSISIVFMIISFIITIYLIRTIMGKKNEYIQIQQADGAELSYL